MNIQKFLFISTPFRSGSALLSRTLNAHSQIGLTNDDLKFFRFCYNRYLPLKENNTRTMLNDLAHRLLTRFNITIEVESCLESLKQQPLNHAAIYSVLLQHLWEGHNNSYIGEMESISWTKIPTFLNMFPNGKALLIIRDLRDVVMSFKKKTIAPGNDYLIALFNVIDAMDHFLDCQKMFPDRFHGVRFEDLKANPEKEVQKVCQFLGVDFEPEMMCEDKWVDYHGEKWINTKVSSFHKDGDSQNPVGRWRKLITPEELFLCEWIAQKQMQAFGLKTEGGGITQAEFDRAIDMITSSTLLREAFKRWCETGKGVERYPLDPTDPKTWEINPIA